MIVVDTNVISEAMRDTPFLSAITVAELRFGIAVLPAGKRRDKMSARLEQEVLPAFAGRVLPFDMDVSAALMARSRQADRQSLYFAAIPRSTSFSPLRNSASGEILRAVLAVSASNGKSSRGSAAIASVPFPLRGPSCWSCTAPKT